MDDTTRQLLLQSLTSAVRHGLTIVCGWFLAAGISLSPDQLTNWTDVSTAIVVGLIAYAWSIWNKKYQAKLKAILTPAQKAQLK